jgi:hypothetical protein
MAGPESDSDMEHHHASVSCRGDQIRHALDRIGGLRSRHELGEGIDLMIHYQQRGAPRINVRKLEHRLLLQMMSFLSTCSLSVSWLGLLQGISQKTRPAMKIAWLMRFGRGDREAL